MPEYAQHTNFCGGRFKVVNGTPATTMLHAVLFPVFPCHGQDNFIPDQFNYGTLQIRADRENDVDQFTEPVREAMWDPEQKRSQGEAFALPTHGLLGTIDYLIFSACLRSSPEGDTTEIKDGLREALQAACSQVDYVKARELAAPILLAESPFPNAETELTPYDSSHLMSGVFLNCMRDESHPLSEVHLYAVDMEAYHQSVEGARRAVSEAGLL